MSGKLTAKDIKDKLNDGNLDLSLCDLAEVPVKEIALVKKFTILDLSNNLLTSLPKTFATLTQIVKLDLSKNSLTEIPENFGELRQLKHLDLYGNQISRLPLSLGELKNLKWLDLKENPLSPAVATVAGPCSNASECQACARNVVSYLASVKVSIEEEKQRRLNVVQEVEKSVSHSKKEAKKAKKNAEKKASAGDKSPLLKKEQSLEKSASQSPKFKTSRESPESESNLKTGIIVFLCRVFVSLVMWLALFPLLSITVLAIFPLYDEQRAEELFKFIETESGIPFKSYHQEGIRLLEMVFDQARLYTNHAREVIEKTYQQYFLQGISPEEEETMG
ncbi:hypothetical protein QAD02_009643 [Eretmocerus hayati]|uniref:Uncharacterized protein n=1 Tax=Eretmocerus hayati TaxID=131215 RepID=A0ACC2NEE5_9HYME|nr:hypothetical protein QAD02_009643 [Eretmocerus hayati]